jgi:hypothetical protein
MRPIDWVGGEAMPASKMKFQALAGAVCWLAGVQFFVIETFVRWDAIGYSPRAEDVSLLGIGACGPYTLPLVGLSFAVCSPRHDLLNASLIVLGLSWIAGAWLTRRCWPQTRLAGIALALIAIGGAGMTLCGAFALDRNAEIHIAGAVLHFLVGAPGILLLGVSIWPWRRWAAVFPILCGLLGFVAFALYGNTIYLGLGRGAMERIAVYSTTLWMVVTGASLLLRAAKPR